MSSWTSAGNTGVPLWFKSSYSDSSNPNDCVEVGPTPTAVHIRDSKDRQGSRLAFTPDTWSQFVAYAAEAEA